MRGAVTIAAALFIPLETDAGAPLPGRDLIVFFAFAVVLGDARRAGPVAAGA